jgi:quercetin 2,3-dioxygenase
MPAITVENPLLLPRIAEPDAATSSERPVRRVARAMAALEGAGFPVWRGFTGLPLTAIDPFVLLDQLGPVVNGPFETKGAPWHPHRGFETVTYVLDGEIAHHDSHGGGGLISDGDTQWMTAGAGILHDEMPSERVFAEGGPQHGIQLWVNLPTRLKFATPRYQPITSHEITLLSSPDGGTLVRLIAGQLGGHLGPGSTHTPITLAHASLAPGARLVVPWDVSHNAMAYVLTGSGSAGTERRPLPAHHLALFGDGDHLTIGADDVQPDGGMLEVLLLGGSPLREPIVHYGPFVMNTDAEIREAIDDFQAGRMGSIPAGR